MIGTTEHAHDLGYEDYLRNMSERFAGDGPVFRTENTSDLFELYLSGFPAGAERQYHNCSACRTFLHRYAGLVRVDPGTGRTTSALFDVETTPVQYRQSITEVVREVEGRRATGVFLSALPVLGTPRTGEWGHLSVRNPRVYTGRAKAAHEAEAEKLQDYQQVSRALAEFPVKLLEQVVEMLSLDQLYRGEKVLGPATWLRDLARLPPGERRRTRVLRAVALAPAGFCHPRSSMIGSLLEDLLAGNPFDEAAARFRRKMHPLDYQRPKATPMEGALDAAERLVAKLGVGAGIWTRILRMTNRCPPRRPRPWSPTCGGMSMAGSPSKDAALRFIAAWTLPRCADGYSVSANYGSNGVRDVMIVVAKRGMGIAADWPAWLPAEVRQAIDAELETTSGST